MKRRPARIVVRGATTRDRDAIAAMRLALLDSSRGNAAHRRLRRDIADDARRLFASQLPDARCLTLVALDGAERVGLLRCMISVANPLYDPPRHAYLLSVYVQPSHRRRGVLKRLLGAAARWCRAHGIDEMRLHAGVENRVGRAAWQALGFEPAEVLYVRHFTSRRATPRAQRSRSSR